jgi:hypothetical protein
MVQRINLMSPVRKPQLFEKTAFAYYGQHDTGARHVIVINCGSST